VEGSTVPLRKLKLCQKGWEVLPTILQHRQPIKYARPTVTFPVADHSRALRVCLTPLPMEWNRPSGRPRHTWLQTAESDPAPLNIGLATTYHWAQSRQAWSTLVGTATSSTRQATRWWWWWWWAKSHKREPLRSTGAVSYRPAALPAIT